MSQISFTIPLTSSTLRATISALIAMVNDLEPIDYGNDTVTEPTPSAPMFATITEPTPSAPMFATITEPTTTIELDSAGQAWNEELHASTRTKVADGTWKKKRGVIAPPSSVTDVIAPPSSVTDEGKQEVVTPPIENIAPPKVEVTPAVNPFRALVSDIAKAGLAPDYVQATCLEVTGGNLVQCKDDANALAMLRMSLGL